MRRTRKATWLPLAGLLILLPAAGCIDDGGDGSGAPVVREESCPATLLQQVCDLVNQERQIMGLPALDVDLRLAAAAQTHADDMALNDFMSHTGTDGSDPADRALTEDYVYSSIGENVAAGFATAEDVVAAWMASPGHRANILGADFEQLGVGYSYADGTQYEHYWSQSFGAAVDGGELPPGGCHP
jgi:uncharacterized protein YkwD